MKRRSLITIVITLAIIVLALIIFALFFNRSGTSAPSVSASNPFANTIAPNASITDFTANCFKTYITAYVANHQSVNNSSSLSQNAQSCFTTAFIAQWPTIISATDGDPVLLAQDYDNSWETAVSVSIASQTSTTATAIVNLGTGTEARQLLAQLQLTPDGWRISGISAP